MRKLILLIVMLAPMQAEARLSHRVAILGAAELGVRPEFSGHGIGLIAYDLEGLPRGSRFGAELNTDTLRLRYEGLSFWDGQLELGFQLVGEALMAGLLTDYYRDGLRDPTRGFNASYLGASAHAKLHRPGRNTLELALTARYWILGAAGDSDPALVLPPDTWTLEPRLRFTHWGVQHDRSWRDRHRLYPRVRGVAFGLEVGLDFRGEAEQWGATSSGSFSPPDLRNDPSSTALLLRQWLLAGIQIAPWARTQIRQEIFWAHGADDLNRARVGGLNPYVTPLAGAPWAAFLSDAHLAARWSWHFKLYRELEAGIMGDLVWLADTERTGSSDDGVMAGVGLFADWQLGAFQIDISVGWCPTLDRHSGGGSLGAMAALGWQWE